MPDTIENPFGNAVELAQRPGALVSVEQQRAIAEVQARMIIARANPRDPIRCVDLILQDCTRTTLAEQAIYQYARGGTDISGPSIRLMETIARRWGNLASGIQEIARQQGYSECVAYAWDMESNYRDEKQFHVRHWRDTKGGGHQIRDERDIYELIANLGQRRKRAALQAVIPGDVVEAAVEQCEATLQAHADTSPEAILKMVSAFGAYGVSKEQIEARCQRRLDAIRPAQFIQLRKIYTSIKDGMSGADDWFSSTSETSTDPATRGTQGLRERLTPQPTATPERKEEPQTQADPPREMSEQPKYGESGRAQRIEQDMAASTNARRRRRRTKAEMEAARDVEARSSTAEPPAQSRDDAGSTPAEFPSYAVVDPDGEVHEFETAYGASHKLADLFTAAANAVAVDALVEDNEFVFRQLAASDETAFERATNAMLHARLRLATPEPTTAKPGIGDASETADRQGPAAAESTEPLQSAELPVRYAIGPVYTQQGKIDYRVMVLALLMPKLRAAKTREEFDAWHDANRETIQEYKNTLGPAGAIATAKEIDDILAALP